MIVLASVLHMTGRVFDRSYTVDSTGRICGSQWLSDLHLYVNLYNHLFTYCLDLPFEYIVNTCIRIYIVHRCTVHKENLYTVDSTGMICGFQCLSDLYLYVNFNQQLFTYCLDLPFEYIVNTCIRVYIVHRCTVHKENCTLWTAQVWYVVLNVYPTSICMQI